MMKILLNKVVFLFILLGVAFPSGASDRRPFERELSEFQGENLVLGCGNYAYFSGQRKIHPDTEYSIDLKKYVYPCKYANAMLSETYEDMPDNRFAKIEFTHIGFSPIFQPPFYDESGINSLLQDDYSEANWREILNIDTSLPPQLFRILRSGGNLFFKTCVCYPLTLTQIYIWSDNQDAELPIGLQVWKRHYEKAGFVNIVFSKEKNEKLGGYYIQMQAQKAVKKTFY